jgi:hypothetical protein
MANGGLCVVAMLAGMGIYELVERLRQRRES